MSAIPSRSSKTKEYIEKARAKHGERYDYSRTVYVRSRDKIVITCLEHGEFEQVASSHLKGNGCAKCGLERGPRVTHEEFIRRARARHGNRYDYSQVAYTKMNARVKIICARHGLFEQTPHRHVQGSGCQACARLASNGRRWNTSKFITRANAVHGGRYTYSRSEYLNREHETTITCPEHGDFKVTPRRHLGGAGCRPCEIKNRTDEFVRKAKRKHGDAYTYSKARYVKWDAPVVITCRAHGDFEQRADHHWAGKGCIKCGKSARLTTGDFIEKAVQVHGDKYDYSEARYVNGTTLITISCSEHGEFEQTPTHHLHLKTGCPRCGGGQVFNTRTFIEKAQEIHGDRYDYSLVEYVKGQLHVTIRCSDHGNFEQKPVVHLVGSGCQKCPPRFNEPTSLYMMAHRNLIKIGYSIDPEERLHRLNRAQPFTAKLIATWLLDDMPTARSAETDTHRKLSKYNAGLSGFDGASEWFEVPEGYAAKVIDKVVSKYQ